MQFIEYFTNVWPDGGSGASEVWLLCLAGMVCLGFSWKYRTKRKVSNRQPKPLRKSLKAC